MAYSLYDATVVMAKGALASLQSIIKEAQKQPNSSNLLGARLTDDMKPLTFQVHMATHQALFMAAKLSGQDDFAGPPESDIDSYEAIFARIDKTLQILNGVDKDTANGIGETTTTVNRHGGDIDVPVKVLVGSPFMTNVYFHISMAYAILRKEGVPLEKKFWTRGFVADYL
jgi:uncharacterized protein